MDENLEAELRRIGVASELDADYGAARKRISEARKTMPDPTGNQIDIVKDRITGKYLTLLKMEDEGRNNVPEYIDLAASIETDIGIYDKFVAESGGRSSRRMTAVVEGIKKRFVEPGKTGGSQPNPKL